MKKQLSNLGIAIVAITFTLTPVATAEALKVDPKLPAYQPVSGVSGNLNSIGSDTLNNLMTLWAETFRKFYPSVKVQVEGKGSSTAPPALIAGTSQFGPMSRQMRATEIDQFEAKYKYKPTELRTSYDALAVYVHKDNPIQKLTLAQVEAMFGKTRKRGYRQNIATWGQVGLTGDWANRPISLYGRNAASGTYGFFKELALKNGDYKTTVKEQPGSASVVQGVENDMYGIGYSGIGYKTSGVKSVALAKKAGEFVADTPENVLSGKYPLARFLYVYVNQRPGSELDPLRREFLRYVLSKEGQSDVIKDGYYPLTAEMAAKALGTLGMKAPPAEVGGSR